MKDKIKTIVNFFKTKKGLALFLVFLAMLFTAVFHLPELIANSPDVNDNAFHLGLAHSFNDRLNLQANPLDYWIPYWMAGYPVFHDYQFIPSFITVFVYRIFLEQVSLQFIMHLLIYLLLVFFPLIIYYSFRKIGFGIFSSTISALFSLGISGNFSYGWDYSSYVWQGFGMYSQLFGMFFMPLFIARAAVCLKTGKCYGSATLFFILTFLSHILFGYIACIICLLLLIRGIGKDLLFKSVRRLILLFFILATVTSYFWLPMIIDSKFHYRSVFEPIEKFNSYGYKEIITRFISGELLDFGRFPIMTILCIAGLLFAFYKSLERRNGIYRFAFCGFFIWFFLYFGRATWGRLIDLLLPMSKVIHMERFVNGLHFFVIAAVGMGVEFIWEQIKKIKKLLWKQKFILLCIVIILAVIPIFKERGSYLLLSDRLAAAYKIKFDKEWPEFKLVLDKIKTLPPGRVYCGWSGGWGDNYKVGGAKCYHVLSQNGIENLGNAPFSWTPVSDFQISWNDNRYAEYVLYNIKYVISDKEKIWPDFIKPIFQSGRHTLYQVETGGYFDLVESDIFLQANKNISRNFIRLWLISDLRDKNQFMTIGSQIIGDKAYQNYIFAKNEYKFTSKIAGIDDSKERHIFENDFLFNRFSFLEKENLGQINNENKNNEVYQAEFTALKPAYLLFKVNYHPNWHILIDGQEQEKLMFSPGMIGVAVSPGTHAVKAFYRPQTIKVILFFIGLIILIIVLFKNGKKIF